jgi:Flp pilus assembly protein TadD
LLDEPRAKNSQQLYYAVCWALVHMLLVEQPERIEVLLKASPSDAVFGKALQDLQQYVARPIWRQQAVDAPRASIEYKVEIIPAVDAEFLVATLLLDADKPEAARRHYGRLATAHRGEAIGAEASGLSALAAGEREAAKREFRRAVELRSTRARVWSELAVLEKEDGAPWEKVKPLLERAAVLDPSDFQPAYLLGVHEADDGELTNATAHLASASQAAPGKSDIWHAYALALQQANRVKEAQVAAQHAMRVAASTEWEERARVLLESLSRPAGGPAQSSVRRKPEVVTSPAWTAAQPDARAEGRFLAFDCQSTPPILRIGRRDGASDLEFKISDPRQVNLLNTGSGESSIRLDCGPQDGRPIRVGYRASDGTVLELEFLQVHDLPRF